MEIDETKSTPPRSRSGSGVGVYRLQYSRSLCLCVALSREWSRLCNALIYRVGCFSLIFTSVIVWSQVSLDCLRLQVQANFGVRGGQTT